MTIPVYRHNLDHDDWEVASVYDSDDCGSLGGSAYSGSLHSSGSVGDPALHLESYHYDGTRPLFVNGYPVPQQQRQNYPPATLTRPRWDARCVPGKQSSFVVPPPGVIFPPKDWVLPPQDTYWPSTTNQTTSSSMAQGVGLRESPPSPPLLLSPSSPPRAPSPLIRRPSPATAIAHGQLPHARSLTVSGTGTRANVSSHGSPIMPPPPRYHEAAQAIPPRLADAGCQAHLNMVMTPPRRSGHDVLSSYAPGPGHASMPRAPRSSEEFVVAERRGGGGPGGHPSYGLGDRPDVHPPPVLNKYEHEREHVYEHEHDGGRTRMGRLQTRERRPSIWQRFVRRFSPSHVSVGQT